MIKQPQDNVKQQTKIKKLIDDSQYLRCIPHWPRE